MLAEDKLVLHACAAWRRTAAAKAQALFIHKHGKEEFFKLQNVMHKARDFKKIQEILGQNTQECLRILEGFMKTEADDWRTFDFWMYFYQNTIILKWYFKIIAIILILVL